VGKGRPVFALSMRAPPDMLSLVNITVLYPKACMRCKIYINEMWPNSSAVLNLSAWRQNPDIELIESTTANSK